MTDIDQPVPTESNSDVIVLEAPPPLELARRYIWALPLLVVFGFVFCVYGGGAAHWLLGGHGKDRSPLSVVVFWIAGSLCMLIWIGFYAVTLVRESQAYLQFDGQRLKGCFPQTLGMLFFDLSLKDVSRFSVGTDTLPLTDDEMAVSPGSLLRQLTDRSFVAQGFLEIYDAGANRKYQMAFADTIFTQQSLYTLAAGLRANGVEIGGWVSRLDHPNRPGR